MAATDAILGRLLEPMTEWLSPEGVRKLIEFRADAETQQRVDELADKNTEGLLTPDERDEYEAYVYASTLIAILQAKARATLAHPPAA